MITRIAAAQPEGTPATNSGRNQETESAADTTNSGGRKANPKVHGESSLCSLRPNLSSPPRRIRLNEIRHAALARNAATDTAAIPKKLVRRNTPFPTA